MELEYGTEVVDKNDRILGMVDYVIRNTWTGEVSKFAVRPKGTGRYRFYSPQDVLEATESRVKVNVALDELSENA